MKHLFTPILACALAVLTSPCAFAQWDYGQDSTWNMIEHRMEMRRMRERMQANKKKGSRTNTKKSATSRRKAGVRKVSAPAKPAPAPLPPYGIQIRRDGWQDFAFDSPDGFKTNFTKKAVRPRHLWLGI